MKYQRVLAIERMLQLYRAFRNKKNKNLVNQDRVLLVAVVCSCRPPTRLFQHHYTSTPLFRLSQSLKESGWRVKGLCLVFFVVVVVAFNWRCLIVPPNPKGHCPRCQEQQSSLWVRAIHNPGRYSQLQTTDRHCSEHLHWTTRGAAEQASFTGIALKTAKGLTVLRNHN